MTTFTALLYVVLIMLTFSSGRTAHRDPNHLRRRDARRVFNRCLVTLGATPIVTLGAPKLIETIWPS